MTSALRIGLGLWVAVATVASAAPAPDELPAASGTPTVKLLFTYGSEKKKWIEAVTRTFNADGHRLPSGELIQVEAVAVGSGELVDEIIAGRRKPQLVSPASGVFLDRGNAKCREQGQEDSFEVQTRELVSSPLVVAMWREKAEAIGWPGKRVRWRDVFDYARDPSRWSQIARPGWDKFRYGHTHPLYSNSGLLALFAEAYAALGKFDSVSRTDIVTRGQEFRHYLQSVESSIVHYGESTGFFATKMYEEGPDYLTAAILYENLVIEANQELERREPAGKMPRIVAIYPAEGTFPCEHPISLVRRDWVTPQQAQAGHLYIDYLLARPRQVAALKYGFRPAPRADDPIPLSDLWEERLGVRKAEPVRLKTPTSSVASLILDRWEEAKRHSDIVLVIDTSASMKGEKVKNAEEGAKAFIDMFGDDDTLSTLIFGTEVEWLLKATKTDDAGKSELKMSISGLIPEGDTALFEAISTAYQYLSGLRQSDNDPKQLRNRAIVILSDGKDTRMQPSFPQVLTQVSGGKDGPPIMIFTIGYGDDADAETLKRISKITRGEYSKGTIQDIRKIFTKIAVYF